MTAPPDPLQSPLWDSVVEKYLGDHPIVFTKDIEVGLPPVTEDQTQVPITIDARKLGKVELLQAIADLHPFQQTLKVKPNGAPAFVAYRQRIEQGTVIRAAALKDGTWHVAGQYLDASGGGCSAPPVTEAKVDWDHLGQMRAKIWRESADTLRLRLRILHPMDTGLQKEPRFIIESIKLSSADGKLLSDVETFESIEANPTFTFLVIDPKSGDHIGVVARDSDGHTFKANVPLVRTAEMTPTVREGRL